MMLSKLDHLTASARASSSFEWSEERSQSVLAATLVRRDQQVRRARIARRLVVGASGVATVLVLFLKVAGATDTTTTATTGIDPAFMTSEPTSPPAILAESLANDGGYLTD